MKRLFQQVHNSRKLFVISVIFGCLGGLILIAEAYYVANIVDDVFLEGLGLAEVKLMLALLLAVIIIRALLHMVSDYTASKLAQGIKSELRLRLVKKLGDLGPEYSKEERSGELVSTLYEGVEQLENYLAKYVPQIVLSMFVPFAIFVLVVGQDGLSALVYAITLPLLILFMILIGKFTKSRTDRQYKLLGRLGGHFQEILRGMETLKIFNRSKAQLQIIGKISEEHRKSTMATLKLAFLSAFVMELFATISTAVIAVFLGLRLVKGQMEFYDAFLILLLTPEFYAPIRALGTQFHSGMNGASAATRIFNILDAKPSGYVEKEDGLKPASVQANGYRIQFQHVTVHYEGYETPALHDVSFTVEPGQQLAIVGATGAGKSTILDLLQGFIKPTSGKILIDGVDLAELSIGHWRKQLSTVSQKVHLFHGTIRENILLGLEHVTDEQVRNILEQAGADRFVSQLPQGLNTKLGDAIQLSGGQIQRLAIARALLRHDAKLILLDEATNGLDVFHEQLVHNNLKQWIQGRSAVIVAHQLESITSSDYILVLKDGEVAESGSPAHVLAKDGLFAQMITASKGHEDATNGHDTPKVTSTSAKSELRIESSTTDRAQKVVTSTAPYESVNWTKTKQTKHAQDNEEAFSFRSIWKATRNLMTFLAQYKWLALCAVLLSFATIAANIGLMGTSGYLIAKAALQPENILMIYVPIVGVRFFGISRSVFRYLERLASHNVTFKVLHRLRIWLYERLEPKGITLFQHKRGGDVLGSVISDIEQLQNFYLRLFSPPVVYALTVVLTVGFLSTVHIKLAIVSLIMLVIAGVVIPYIGYRNGKQRGVQLVNARIGLYEHALDLLRGMATIQQFGTFTSSQQQITKVQDQLNHLQLQEHRNTSLNNGLMTAITQLSMWVMLIISIPLIVDGSIAPYMLPAILLITLASFEAAAPLPQAFQMSSGIATAANRLFVLADDQEQPSTVSEQGIVNKQSFVPNENTNDIVKRFITTEQLSLKAVDNNLDSLSSKEQTNNWQCDLSNVQFSYENRNHIALEGINLTLKKGRKMAVVGESGAGKSTLLHAILKLSPITNGEISINGMNYDQCSEEQVRSQYAVVSQQVQLFNATVAENLRLGNQAATLEQLRVAAQIAEIDSFIMSLPSGYNTMIGEYGAKLSGGQRQRLALARAIIRQSNAILLDEPATGLDRLTQKAFHDNMREMMVTHAVLWITHRLADITDMDEIIVLKQGRIVEQGTHEQLMDAKGHYYDMWCLERSKDWEQNVS
ncbi:MAG: thiol reductant ABC exporter subunit CydD [Candidatus Pristimantibacillus lignocellulolyticus]|uniref:Thiol reductant ABC exporter subunit CydD n=1 Tax=Candidatus Pristimantibacillus lignocellulolyticus TaxID=2994561 RepID=A0A9J6ZEZ2_9BACL|nr:MAG: thiol reductant ABC exporter subunit CydD [Candidatus Pristimantibacillus lignocellulolyticus]